MWLVTKKGPSSRVHCWGAMPGCMEQLVCLCSRDTPKLKPGGSENEPHVFESRLGLAFLAFSAGWPLGRWTGFQRSIVRPCCRFQPCHLLDVQVTELSRFNVQFQGTVTHAPDLFDMMS